MYATRTPTLGPITAATEERTAGREAAPLVLERYRLHRRLGAGAFGTVWLARDERLEREVAVKLVPRERVNEGRFEREARAAARLAHPGIVTLYEAAVDDEGAYLVSELVRGKTLAELLTAGRLSDRDIVSVGIALCDALAHAHEHGVVHRDVKPSNVLIPARPSTPAQLAKLTDFGVARVMGGDSLTRTGDVVGTAAYMAPEQAEGLEAGPSADLYSLALVTYEALTGVNPVLTTTAAQRARRLGTHLPPLRRQRRDLPRVLGQGLDLALRPHPRERGRLDELREALLHAHDFVNDRAGIVTSRWQRRAADAGHELRSPPAERSHRHEHDPELEPRPEQTTPGDSSDSRAWPARALAVAAAATLVLWLSIHVLTPPPIAPTAAAMLAGFATLVLPRLGWAALSAALVSIGVAQHHPGAALVIALGASLPVALMLRDGTAWPLAVGAPALGLLGMALGWPAVAARARGAWRRSAIGAIGWVWLVLAGGLNAAPGRLGSTGATFDHVLRPLAGAGGLAPALVWAGAALTLPWTVSRRSLAWDAVRVCCWTGALTLGTAVGLALPGAPHGILETSDFLAGALASAAIALLPTGLRALRPAVHSRGSRARLA
ncbi:MAG: serine/threonine protein kinase [Solirubrobacterales bacterium]|nr:serine/threonine protein kinase [Solirubrobacterales bacterium]